MTVIAICMVYGYADLMEEIRRLDGAHVDDVILDSINEGVFTVDSDWKIRSFNRAAEVITGVPRREAIGRPCCEVFRASICESTCALRKTIETGQPIANATAHIIGIRGNRLPIRISTALLRDEGGHVIGGVETFQDLSQVAELRKELEGRYRFEDIVGRSAPMVALFRILPQAAESESTVLIEGASGTGKELVARAIHNLSTRRRKRFVAVNCGALPDTLLESELFGYRAGAFTDARRDKVGRFALADGGTLFLDEVGDVSPAMQVRLLRVLQERVIEPLGSVDPVKVDVRVVAATNRDLNRLVRQGRFREDLFYRIRVVQLRLPSLRQRREDIPLLVEHVILRLNRLRNREIGGVSDEVMEILMGHEFRGNVRELENIMEQAFVLCREGLIGVEHLPPELRPRDLKQGSPPARSLRAAEQQLIVEALLRHRGNRQKTARELGLDPSTLYRKIKVHGIAAPPTDGRARRQRRT